MGQKSVLKKYRTPELDLTPFALCDVMWGSPNAYDKDDIITDDYDPEV